MDVVPPRSLLLRPEPKGKGTGAIESLRSYYERLARLHCVTPIQLVWELAPALRRGGAVRKIQQYWNTRTLLLTKVISEATARTDLGGLTLDPWESVLSAIGLRAKHQKWCPLCLEEDPYERLSWSLACTESCIVHGKLLLDRCPKCGKQVNVRQTGPAWHTCPICRKDRSEDKTKWSTGQQDWTANQINGLLIAGQSGCVPAKDRIYQIWNDFILPLFASVEDASSTLGISRSIPDSVLYVDTRRCTLPILLALSQRLGVNVDELLLRDLTALNPHIGDGDRISLRRVIPREEVDRRVTKACRHGSSVDQSIRKLCLEIGIAPATFRSRYPSLSNRLTVGFQEKQRAKKQRNKELRLNKILAVIRERSPKVSNWAIQRAGKFCTRRLWKELCAEARNRASSERTKLSEHADACLAAVACVEGKSIKIDTKGK